MRIADSSKGIFPIGVVADMIGTSQKQLRVYESKGVIAPTRSDGNRRLYSQQDVERLTFIHYLVSVEKINLAGVNFILELMKKFPEEERNKLILSVEESISRLSTPEKEAFEEEEFEENGNPLLHPPHTDSTVFDEFEIIKNNRTKE